MMIATAPIHMTKAIEVSAVCPSVNKRRILVTGGAGFIGSHLVDELIRRKHYVTVLDNLSTGSLENLPKNNLLNFIQGDIRDSRLVEKLVKDSDVVFHLAEFIPPTKSYGAGHVVKYSVDNPLEDFDISTRGTLLVLDSIKKHHKKMVFTSTAAVYGNVKTIPLKEEIRPRPMSPYGTSKVCAEEYIKTYSRIYNVMASIVRLFNVYGPRQSKYVIYDILLKLEKNQNHLEMFGTGREVRDFVYVRDAVDALILVAQDELANGQVYNVGSGHPTKISELVNIVLKILSLEPDVDFLGSSWKGDVDTLVADISRISEFGYRPKFSLEEGLGEFIRWYKNSHAHTT